ncbi:MAG: NAD(P)H-dependent oxidoreductase [Burkholderiales bacterium]|nr:NAD(P)H-dependent oxidoreductase [Burkholderiales bacterium]MDE2431984.1 NAD(P)H-dependent oxidoreductase [Burkholderiales bacterium]
MSQSHKVAVVVGSLRKESWNRKIALALQKLAPASLQLSVVEIADLPFYNEDLDASPPAAWSRFRDEIRASDAVLFITPEYNRSVPAALKNALDVGSRPYGHSVWSGKPGAVISASPGQIGGFGANHHLRQSLVFLNVLMLQQPEAYLGSINKSFDDAGQLASDHTREFLSKFITAFDAWVQRVGAGGASSSGA